MKKVSSHFYTGHLKSDLKKRVIRGAAATFVGQGTKFLLQIGSTMVLARLLTPDDFGIVAMVTAVTGFILIFKDLGLSMATVQREEINHAQVSTLFWINLALSALLMLITIALAPAIAWFYGDPRLAAITTVLSVAFLFGGLTVQHQALLRRQMHLTAVTVIDVSAMASGILAAVICAWIGLGYWSLVWMQIVMALATAIGVWIASGWIPGLPTRRSGVRSMLKFGSHLSAFSFVNYFARNSDNILIGRFLGAESLGLYSRAYSLLLLPIGQITAPMTAVALPVLSRLQDDPERYRSYYLRAIRVVAYLTFPFVTALLVLAEEVIAIVLGHQWAATAPIFQVLAIAAFFQPITSTAGWLYISLGETRRMAIWGMVSSALIVASFIIGLPWGVIGVATSYTVCSILLTHPLLVYATASSPLSSVDIYIAVSRPLRLSIIFGVFMLFGHKLIVTPDLISTIFTAFLAGGIGLVFSVLFSPKISSDLREIYAMIRQVKHTV